MYQRVEFACASLILAAIVILVAIASVSRAMGSPIIWSVEIAQLLFVWLCMLGLLGVVVVGPWVRRRRVEPVVSPPGPAGSPPDP